MALLLIVFGAMLGGPYGAAIAIVIDIIDALFDIPGSIDLTGRKEMIDTLKFLKKQIREFLRTTAARIEIVFEVINWGPYNRTGTAGSWTEFNLVVRYGGKERGRRRVSGEFARAWIDVFGRYKCRGSNHPANSGYKVCK